MSNINEVPITKLYTKKLYCPEHGNKFAFKCGYEHCQASLVCSSPQCLQSHFHHQNQDKLVLFKFDSSEYDKKLGELEKLFTKQDFTSEAKTLKAFIDGLKLSMVSIYKDCRQLYTKKDLFMAEINKPFEIGMMEKVQEVLSIGQNLRNSLDNLRLKVNMDNSQNCLPHVQKDDMSSKSEHALQSPKLNGNLEKKNVLQQTRIIPEKNGQKVDKQFQKGEVVIQKSSKQTSVITPIELEDPSQYIQKNHQEIIQEIKSTTVKPKINLEFEKNFSFKNAFDGLFKNGPKSINLNGNPNVKWNLQNLSPKSTQMNGIQPNNPNQTVKSDPRILQAQVLPNKVDTGIRQNLKIYERDFLMKKQLTLLLQQRVENFSWGRSQQIYTSQMSYKPIQRFHQLLQERRNLLFIFIGQNRILGSYYPSKYPKLVERLRNDPNSFMFISNDEGSRLIEFKAVPCEFHLSVSERLYICHGNTPSYADGIRTTQKNFNELNYYLPSESFKYPADSQKGEKKSGEDSVIKSFSGNMKVKEFFILQLSPLEQASIQLY